MTSENKTQNYDVYFPVQLWVSKTGLFRFQPPLLGIPDRYEFSQFFWDTLSHTPDERQRLAQEWFVSYVFWAFNPKIVLTLNRGFHSVLIQQRNTFPFDSISFTTTTDPYEIFQTETQQSLLFSFIVYTVKIPTTWLLFMEKQTTTLCVRLCDPNKGCPYESHLPFLPSHEAKNISCYDLFGGERGFFCYVFPKRPTGTYFRLTSENICAPSDNTRDYICYNDCMKASLSPRVLSNNVYTMSCNQALETVMYTFPETSHCQNNLSMYVTPIVLGFLMTCVLCVLLSR